MERYRIALQFYRVSGTSGEFYRYKTVFIKPPTDEDRMFSLQLAKDVKCHACEVLMKNLLKKALGRGSHKLDADAIMDQLDGEHNQEDLAAADLTAQDQLVMKQRKGCNKHFKDELLAHGWKALPCSEGSPTFCLTQGSPMTYADMETYDSRKDGLFYACENTVGAYGSELAEYIAESVDDGRELDEIVSAACKNVAFCEGRKKKKRKRSEL